MKLEWGKHKKWSLLWLSPSEDSLPIKVATWWEWNYSLSGDWGGGVKQVMGAKMTNGFLQSVWPKGNKWVCSSFLAISHTHKHCWFSFTQGTVGWFISTYAPKCRNLDEWQKVETGRVLEQHSSCSLLILPLPYTFAASFPVTFQLWFVTQMKQAVKVWGTFYQILKEEILLSTKYFRQNDSVYFLLPLTHNSTILMIWLNNWSKKSKNFLPC